MTTPVRRRLAVVGSGIAGLCAAWVLSRRHDVTILEADERLGGHTNTVPVEVDGRRLPVDTGFIVFNDWTYPNFIRLLDQLGVESQASDMSFSVKREDDGLEYNGNSLNTLFAQRANLLRPSFWGMIRDIMRFNKEAPRLLDDPDPKLTLEEFLRRGGFGTAFVDNYLMPMGAAIWSTAPERMRAFPAAYFVRFFANHGFLSIDDRPTWRVVKGGSRTYVDAIERSLDAEIRRSSPVERVARRPDGVLITVRGHDPEPFDGVVLACHSDQALRLLADPSDAERAILGAIPYQENVAILHTDARLLPKRKLAWASWNYHVPVEGCPTVAVTYWMNRLQNLDTPTQLLVTLNREELIDPKRVLRRIVYHHPLYTPEGVAAQDRHAEISGVRNTWYCGAWWRYGFHEDGVVSALNVCRQFGMEL